MNNTLFVRLTSLGLLSTISILTLHGAQSSQPNRPWPSGVQKVSNQSPPLSPEEEMKTFHMPPGYRVELVASEPMVQEPVAMDWDLEGRLWVVEMPGWMANLTGSNELEPLGRVVVLEDANGDGRMDKRTVFADKLVLARSIKVLDRGVLVAEPPNVWLMRDTNGDLRMDAKELVTDKYGRRDADPQNNANGFLWALDNRMYTAGQADIQLRLKDDRFEVQRTLQRGEWGVTQDDAGRIYRNTNESALHVDLVPTAYFARSPNLVRTRGSYYRLADDNPDLNVVWPVRPNPGTNRAYQTGIDRPDGSLAKFTSVCAPTVYRGDRLPAELYGNVFVAEPAANVVGRLILGDDGTNITARKAYPQGDFLASTDERFRPVYFSDAPDGTLYIADLYRGIIEHRISITKYLRDQILSRQLDEGIGYGRIYRVMHDSTKRAARGRVSKASPARLVDMLSHPNGWHRDTAQRLLVERHAKAVAPALVKLAETAKDWRVRLRALWTLDGLDAIDVPTVAKALQDPSRDVRASAIRVAERWLGQAGHPILTAVSKRVEDEDWWVRQQLAASIGVLPAGPRETLAVSMLERYGDDPVVMDAALSSLRGSELAVLDALMTAKTEAEQTPQREAAMTMLAATVIRSSQEAAIQYLMAALASDGSTPWRRSVLLRGLEVALVGAPMPDRIRQSRAAPAPASPAAPLPCPTCPGGRAGPGGAYAFPRPADWNAGAGRGDAPMLRLNREPVALSSLAATTDDLGPRAARVLARVSWPGKPGEPAPVAPLTSAEQQRFDAGREVYKNVCQGCHQPDGRGQDKIAPSLIGSSFAFAPADIPARILLHGKEGSIGLMPPIGSTLNDDQIAAVLTYVRREWGQTGTPVDPETVKTVRAATSGRARPWTETELMALPGAPSGGRRGGR